MTAERRRIVLINNQGLAAHGGGPTILRRVAAVFLQFHDVTVASFDPPDEAIEGVRQITLPVPEIRNWRFAPLCRARHLRHVLVPLLGDGLDIVIAMDCHLGSALSGLDAKLKAYIALSCAPRQEWFGRAKGKLSIAAQYAFLERHLIRECDLTIVASESQRAEIRRFEFLPNFAPLILRPIFQDRESDLQAARPAPSGGAVFVTLCRLVPGKRVDLVLAIADRMRDHDCHFVIVGDGPLLGPLRARAAEMGVADFVEFVGASDCPETFLRGADFLLHPSVYESFGIAIFEAMRHGTVPVFSRGEGSTIGIAGDIEDGVSGLLVDFGDLESVCRVLETVLSDGDSRRRMQAAAQQRAASMVQTDYVGALASALSLRIA